MKVYILATMVDDEPLPINYRAYANEKDAVAAFDEIVKEDELFEAEQVGSLRAASTLEGDYYLDLVELEIKP